MTGSDQAVLALPTLGRLLPMHLLVTATGHIRSAGPTLVKLADRPLAGRRLVEAFVLRRPRSVASVADLTGQRDGRVALELPGPDRLLLKGTAQPAQGGEVLVNLGFGIAVVDAVTRHGLTAADFPPTDLAVEMIYLAEARTAVMAEALKLADRLRQAQHAAEALALADPLTGLGNRLAMDQAIARNLGRGSRFGLMQLDLDFFKAVNDTLGHAAGDAVLKAAAQVLRGAIRSDDMAARIGGDEFLMLFPEQVDIARLAEIGRRIIAGLERLAQGPARGCHVSGSIGIGTTAMYSAPHADRMLRDIDAALYASKRGGRGRVTVAGEQGARPPAASEREAG